MQESQRIQAPADIELHGLTLDGSGMGKGSGIVMAADAADANLSGKTVMGDRSWIKMIGSKQMTRSYASSAVMTAQGRPRTPGLKTAKGLIILRPRGMKGFVWDYIVDLKLDVMPDLHFKPKKGLPRILTSDVFYDIRKPLEEAGYDVTSREAANRKTRQTIQVQYIKEICDSLEIRRAAGWNPGRRSRTSIL